MHWFPRLSDRAAQDEMLIFYHFVKIPELKKLVQDVSNRVKKTGIPYTKLFERAPKIRNTNWLVWFECV